MVIHASRGTLAQQLKQTEGKPAAGLSRARRQTVQAAAIVPQPDDRDLEFYNGFGGFDAATGEYVILHRRDEPLPHHGST